MSIEVVCDGPARAGKFIDAQLEAEPKVLDDLVNVHVHRNSDTQWIKSYTFHMASDLGPAGEFNGVTLVTAEIEELETGGFAVTRLGVASEHPDLAEATHALIHGVRDGGLDGTLPRVPVE